MIRKVFVALVVASVTGKRSPKIGLKGAAPSACGCQCSDLVWEDKYGTVHGNCRSADHTKAKWCYVKEGSTCSDLVPSARHPRNPWSYQACATPTQGRCGGSSSGFKQIFALTIKLLIDYILSILASVWSRFTSLWSIYFRASQGSLVIKLYVCCINVRMIGCMKLYDACSMLIVAEVRIEYSLWPIQVRVAWMAQLVARQRLNLKVVGSNPSSSKYLHWL